ncbi:acyltransferase domain-containing protein [Kitasatospora sp. NPDC088548]|uniref:acyltransferase domain-containing protein n=1 Tax=Kitasatospora sp. NPDC088548 TaxID=3364075 RepID=UPI00381CD018
MTDLAPGDHDVDPDAHIAVVGLAARIGQADGLDAFRGCRSAGPADPTAGPLADPYAFDHRFFGISPRESAILDPQQRLLLECAQHALEDAAHDPARDEAVVGIYAGGATTTHAARLRGRPAGAPPIDDRQIRAATGADFLASRVAYKLGLTGPAVSVQAAGATAPVAVHTAVQALLGGECDLALAGSVGVLGPEGAEPGGGCAVAVLKPLRAALDDGDRIYAVVRGTAVGTTGPGESAAEGRARIVRDALAVSGVAADTVAEQDTAPGRGVTDTAPAAAAFVRAVLAVHDGPGRRADDTGPRRASAGGSGPFGTHAHVIVEQPPAAPRTGPAAPDADGWQLLPYSAKSATALAAVAARLGRHLERAADGAALQDAAWTLQTGRTRYAHRGFVVARDPAGAAAALAGVKVKDKDRPRGSAADDPPPVVFTFPGHGGQHAGMARGLYRLDPYFRADLDACVAHVLDASGIDLGVVYDPVGEAAEETARQAVADGRIAQLAVFVLEYALAKAFVRWGVRPAAVVGHSLGGYAAACTAGVFSFPDAVRMVLKRTELLLTLAPGAMAAVRLPEAELLPLLPEGVGIAVISGPDQVTVSGPREPVERFVEEHAAKGLETRLLKVPGAGHSSLVDAVLDEYEEFLAGITFHRPAIRVVSDTTGTWADPDEIRTPGYWCRHMRHAVRYHDVLETLNALPGCALVEVGPGTTLTSLARRHAELRWNHPILQGLPHPTDETPDPEILLSTLGALWAAGVEIDWPGLHPRRTPRRTSLPGYPYERSAFPVPAV